MARIPTKEIIVNGRKKIVNADDPRVSEGGGIPSKSDIASMGKKDVAEWLEAHGADAKGKLPEMRDRLRRIIFMEA